MRSVRPNLDKPPPRNQGQSERRAETAVAARGHGVGSNERVSLRRWSPTANGYLVGRRNRLEAVNAPESFMTGLVMLGQRTIPVIAGLADPAVPMPAIVAKATALGS